MIVPDQLKLVVEDLGHFVPHRAFTGGLVLGLYLERQPMFRIFPTKDADAVVACTTHADYISLQLELGQVQARPLAGGNIGEPVEKVLITLCAIAAIK